MGGQVRRNTMIDGLARLAACAALVLMTRAADAAERIPAALTGVWSTEALTYTGANEQDTLYLQADGHGLLIGSQAATRLEGVDDGKPAPRAVAGFPVNVTVDAATLTLQPVLPGQQPAALDSRMRVTYAYAASRESLTCTGPDGKAMVMQRRGDTLPAEVAGMLQSMQF